MAADFPETNSRVQRPNFHKLKQFPVCGVKIVRQDAGRRQQ